MTPSLYHFPIARGVPPSSPRSSDRPAGELFLPALRPVAIIHNQERQRSSGTALGLRWGMYRTTCAVGTTGRRFAGLGCSRRSSFRLLLRMYDLPTGRGLHGSGLFSSALSLFDGIGRRANAILANLIHNAVDHLRNHAVEPFKRHFSISASDRSNPISGAKYAVPHTRVSGTQDDR